MSSSERHDATEKIYRWLGFTRKPSLKLYLGYGHAEQMVIYGHAFTLAPFPRKKYSRFFLVNLFALIKLFIVKPMKGVTMRLSWETMQNSAVSDTDGFIRVNWKAATPPPYGWHTITAQLIDRHNSVVASADGEVQVPHSTQFAFISDIDDTFLISHSANFRKRLGVLFTRNARTRKPFDGVVKHYQLLAAAHTGPEEPNPFFYVSSSEWNLYDYIMEFIRVNGLPKGVLLLNTIKKLTDFLSTGQQGHATKFARIVRVLEAFPKQKFVLLGDSSQQDPAIYTSIVEHFPGRIHAVYIRDIHRKNSEATRELLRKLEATGTPCCFFAHSKDAIEHSRRIGLIS
jgi:phosphatidate phosphatase APP1